MIQDNSGEERPEHLPVRLSMHPHDYRLALTIARNYFECRGYAEVASCRALGDVIMLVHSTGEERPVAIANKAITLLEQRLRANESEQAELFSAFPGFVF